ncbi:MAG: M48 family metalloprotease [Thermoleophilia bacterium]|nr:M48 family metalloprotease [Thermoleophilia bacterium]
MSETTATRIETHSRARDRRLALALRMALLGLLAVGWLLAAASLWRTRVPGDLELPKLEATRFFTDGEVARARSYERFLRADWLLSTLAVIVALTVLAVRARSLARSLRLGPIGAGVVVGMLSLTVVWIVDLPFDAAARWWRDRHGLTRGNWIAWLVDPWPELLLQGAAALLTIVVAMALARRFPRGWWLAAAPAVVAVSVGFAALHGILVSFDSHPLRNRELRRDTRALAARLGAAETPVEVQEVGNLTKRANAAAVGLGPTERIVLWDTLLDGRFGEGEVRVVLAHEFGHITRRHLWKGMAWVALIAFPGLFVLAAVTRRRGGLGDPAVLPLGLLVLVVLELALTPAVNVVSRRYEAEADWVALEATGDPASARRLFQRFARTSLSEPSPPTWGYVMFETHPTPMQRIALAESFAARRSRRGGVDRDSGSAPADLGATRPRLQVPRRCREPRAGCGFPRSSATSTTSPASRRATPS